MRGGFVHNKVLLDSIDALLRRAGAQTQREVHVHRDGLRGAIDLVATMSDTKLAIEAELTPARVVRDVEKARAIEADLLVIVAPTRRIADAIVRRLHAAGVDLSSAPAVCVLPLGPALEQLRRSFPFHSASNPGTETNPQFGG